MRYSGQSSMNSSQKGSWLLITETIAAQKSIMIEHNPVKKAEFLAQFQNFLAVLRA